VRRLAEVEPGALSWLTGQIGDPSAPDRDRVAELIERWPRQLLEGTVDLLQTVARLAEGGARWRAAADVWERLADREVVRSADYLVRAAVAAAVSGDPKRRERLLADAERADPDSPCLRLERLDQHASPEEQLELLGGITADDDASLASLIAAHQARAAMLLPDLDRAESYLATARELDPDALQVRAMSVNLRVQRARIALRDDRTFSLEEARGAMEDALDLRKTMISLGRWEESGRLLMLASDVPSLLRDAAGSERILSDARAEELQTTNGAHVLGDAALRAGADEMALRFVGEASNDDALRRIRATAALGEGGRRLSALEDLHVLAVGGGPEAEYAAFARLGACLPPVKAPWDEEAAAVLEKGPFRRAATGLRVLAVAAGGNALRAEALAADLPQEPWAAELRLRAAGARGNHSLLREAAAAFLSFSPDASGRLLAGLAFATAEDLVRAGEVLAGVAHDVNAPPRVRTDAFAVLLRTLADRREWPQATREWSAWQRLSQRDLSAPDERVSAWQVRIAHHALGLN